MVTLIAERRADEEGTGESGSWEGWEVRQISLQLEL